MKETVVGSRVRNKERTDKKKKKKREQRLIKDNGFSKGKCVWKTKKDKKI